MKTLTNSLYLLLVATLIILLSGCGRNIDGTYTGFCDNSTYGGRGNMVLLIKTSGNNLSGSLTITGDLTGGGDIEGMIDGDNITFVTRSAAVGQIVWNGFFGNNGMINGKYYVETSALNQFLTGAGNQQGYWQVKKQ